MLFLVLLLALLLVPMLALLLLLAPAAASAAVAYAADAAAACDTCMKLCIGRLPAKNEETIDTRCTPVIGHSFGAPTGGGRSPQCKPRKRRLALKRYSDNAPEMNFAVFVST